MSSAAIVIPYDQQNSGNPIAGVDPAQLWALTPSGEKVPKVGTTRTFYNTPESKMTTLSSLGDGYASKSQEVKRELLRKSVASAVKELKSFDGVKDVTIDASADPHAAGMLLIISLEAHKTNIECSCRCPSGLV